MNLFRFQKSKKKKISEVKNFKKGRNPQGSMEKLPPPPPVPNVQMCKVIINSNIYLYFKLSNMCL